mgnify:CR=1 FL=1
MKEKKEKENNTNQKDKDADHSKTERDERGQLHQEFNDRNFHNSVSGNIIPKKQSKPKIRRRR